MKLSGSGFSLPPIFGSLVFLSKKNKSIIATITTPATMNIVTCPFLFNFILLSFGNLFPKGSWQNSGLGTFPKGSFWEPFSKRFLAKFWFGNLSKRFISSSINLLLVFLSFRLSHLKLTQEAICRQYSKKHQSF